MNHLALIRDKVRKNLARNDAQFLMAKSYRGVSYRQITHKPKPHTDLRYRGITYSV